MFGPRDMGVYCDSPRLFILFWQRTRVHFIADINAFKTMFTAARPLAGCEASAKKGDMFFAAPPERAQSLLDRS